MNRLQLKHYLKDNFPGTFDQKLDGIAKDIIVMTEDNSVNESQIVYDELHAVIKRYLSEGDTLTAFGILGAIEATKCDVMDLLKFHNNKTN